jgi:hypothetical protein
MPALKDCLRNFGKASSRLAFPSAQRTVVIETVGPSTVEGTHQYIAPADGYVTVWAEGSASVTVELRIDYPYSSFHRTPPPRGGKRRYLVPVARSFTTHFGGAGSSEGRPTSFLLSVASNNARMEVAA